jgi:uncharacterized protein YqgV (UPF0045/DUF77 family)
LQEILVKDGYIKPRGLAAIDDESRRKLLRSGFHRLVNPFDTIIEMKIDRLLELAEPSMKTVHDAAKKARDRLNEIISSMEEKLQ